MKILNPTYDTVFKYLLEDIEIAKGIISRIINQDIVELMPLPQEQTSIEIEIKYITIPLHRHDFVAAIKYTDDNNQEQIEKIMIEVQKSPFPPEVSRFRQYISDKYHHRTQLKDDKVVDLPIRTIYFIEKTFNKALPPVLHVKNNYYDRLTGKEYTGKHDEFVDLLVHEAYFIQSNNLPPDLKNDLVRVLSILSPKYQINLGKEKRYITIDEDELNRYKDHLLNLIIRRLNLAGENQKLLTALDIEINYEDEWDKMAAERDEAIKRAAQERKEKEEAKAKEQEAMIKLAVRMKKYDETIDEIIKETGLTEDEINNL